MNGAVTAYGAQPKWLYIVEAVVLMLFGLAAIAWPGMTLYTFTVLFGIYALVAGIAHVVGGILRISRGWSAIGSIVLGAFLVGVGSYVFNHPGITALSMVLFVAFSFLIRGVIEIVVSLVEDVDHKALAIVSGVLGVLVGLILLRHPLEGGLAYVWVLGLYALVAGPMMLAVGLGAGSSKPTHHAQP